MQFACPRLYRNLSYFILRPPGDTSGDIEIQLNLVYNDKY